MTDATNGEETLDLKYIAYDALEKAASESDWIPPQYCADDWLADCCEFLRHRQPTAPEGMVVVPREPTKAMCIAGEIYEGGHWYDVWKNVLEAAMLAAHESPNRQVREDSQGFGEPGRLPPSLNEPFGNSEQLESPNADTTPDVIERGQEKTND